MIDVYDNIVDETTQKKVYEWGQSVSWYCSWFGIHDDETKKIIPINEYNPTINGNHNTKHVMGDKKDPLSMLNLFRFSLYRHPIGWSDESVKERNPLIYNMWTQINNNVFGGKASIDGLQETIGGLRGSDSFFINGQNFHKKYDVSKTQREFTCFLNARSCNQLTGDKVGGRDGQIHKDTDPDKTFDFDGSWEGYKYYTVLYVCNLEWQPDWHGEMTYFNDEETGVQHWRRGWNIGWPCEIVGNKPNRVIVYSHDQLHHTQPPRVSAPEMTQKIAFRIKVKK